MEATRAERGGYVWVNVDEHDLWLLGKVIALNEKAKVQIVGNDLDDVKHERRGEVIETTSILPFDRLQLEEWNDALRMSGELNEASLLQLLRRRFARNTIYTFLGDVLVSINPYKDVGSLTATGIPSVDELEAGENDGTLIPHLHVVSERAHRNMLSHGPRGTSQSILINGESGAGKTEAAKCIMKCLAQRSFAKRQMIRKEASAGLNNNLKRMGVFGATQLENRGLALLGTKGRGRGANKMLSISSKAEMDGSEDVEDAGSKVERSFILANPLLEAFGNARTVNNHNSSRFGKFVKIEYDDDGCIVGTNTRVFFLEKSRLVRRAIGEYNFHSFYQLLNAYRQGHELLADGQFGELDTYSSSTPALLISSSRVDNRGQDESSEDDEEEPSLGFNEDISAFEATNRAMAVMGLEDDEQKMVWKTISLILAIGDLQFDLEKAPEKKDNLEHSFVSHNLDLVASMLDLRPDVLEMALCKRSVRAGKRGSVTYTPLSPARARESNEGLAKALYNCLFTWLVESINTACHEATANVQKSRRKEPLFIGVLDIFGFEVLRTNSFEQLCINYANEVMQRFFDQHVFRLEHKIYEEEGVDSSRFTFRDNTPIINLLSAKPHGIFRILDEQGMMGDAATDTNFLQKVETAHRSNTEFFRARPILHRDGLFEVKHFAGSVIYDVTEFIAKNKDILEPDLADLLRSLKSTGPDGSLARFIGEMYHEIHGEKDPGVAVFQREVSNRKLTTLETSSGRFRSQMSDLAVMLEATDQNFIRCVKPNRVKKPGKWDAPLVLTQLKYLSVMEMVRIRTEGFPVRIPFPDFVSKFPELLRPTGFSWYPGTNDKRACETLLRFALGDDSEGKQWVSGATKCFLRDGVMEQLLNMIRDLKGSAATAIQKNVRRMFQRREYLRMRTAAIIIQRWYSPFLSTPRSPADCATKIQAAVRGLLARREAARRMWAIVYIQRFRRKLRKDRRAKKMRNVIKIQAWFRARRCARLFWFFRVQVIRFQAILRGAFVRERYYKVLESREPWKELLKPNEAVVLTSMVVKTSDVHGIRPLTKLGSMFTSKKHRQLIFTTGPGSNELDPTSAPRLFYVDPVTKAWKGEIPYDTGVTCGLTLGDKDFLIFSKQNEDKKDKEPIWTFTDLLGPAVCWIRSIRRNVSVLELVRDFQPAEFHTRVPPSHKGPLLMRQLIGPKKYINLYFTLVGTDLWWIHTPGQTTPSGGVNLTATCNVRLIENPRELPGLPSYAFWVDIPCRAKPLKFRTTDPEVAKAWVLAIERAIKKCRDDEATKHDPVAFADRVYQAGCALFDASNFLGAKIKFKDALDIVQMKGNNRVEAKQIAFECLEHRARCNFVLGLYDKALTDATEALHMKPLHESAMRTRAAALEKLNHYQESIEEYNKLISAAPHAADIFLLRDRVIKTMEVMKGQGVSNPVIPKSKPVIARQASRDAVRESQRSGILKLPEIVSPDHQTQAKRSSRSFESPDDLMPMSMNKAKSLGNPAAAPKRRMDEQEGLLTGASQIQAKRPPISRAMTAPAEPSLTKATDERRSAEKRSSASSIPSIEGEEVKSASNASAISRSSPEQPLKQPSPAAPPPLPRSKPSPEQASKKTPVASSTVSSEKAPRVLASRSSAEQPAERSRSDASPPLEPAPTSKAGGPTRSSTPPERVQRQSPAEAMLQSSSAATVTKPLAAQEPKAPSTQVPRKQLVQRQTLVRATTAPASSAGLRAASASPALKPTATKPSESHAKQDMPTQGASGAVGGATSKSALATKAAKPKAGSGPLAFARAIADYTPSTKTAKEDLTFKKGDEIVVTTKYKDGWWRGTFNGNEGLFPSTFVELIDIREAKGVVGEKPLRPDSAGQ